ncbi:MAG: hypothetical protein M0Z36_07235 [Thermaerobacter sp.]|nr:hypothetical protein [Thermaerobacter sp.]
MSFEGYCFKSARVSKLAAFTALGGFVLFLGGWLALQFLTPLPTVQDISMAIWVGLMAGAALYLAGPRRQQWGHGSLTDTQVIWESAGTIHGGLVRRWRPPRVLVQGPRYFWLIVLGVTLVMAVTGHAPTLLTHNKPDMALFLVLAWQSWITPLYRETLTIQTTAGRRRIYVTKITTADSDLPA